MAIVFQHDFGRDTATLFMTSGIHWSDKEINKGQTYRQMYGKAGVRWEGTSCSETQHDYFL